MARKRRSILGIGWKGGSFRAAVGGYLKKKIRKAGKRLKRSAKKALW